MAPEQFTSPHNVGPTADVYALGKILYHCLTGENGFPRPDYRRVPARFQYLVVKATAHDRRDRYWSVADMLQEFNALASKSSTISDANKTCTQLVAELRSTSSPAIAQTLLEALLRNQSDEHLYAELVPLIDASVLGLLHNANENHYRTVIETFDRSCSGRFPFDFTNRIADFFKAVYQVSSHPALRLLALKRILVVGHEHNRYYVRGVFREILSGLGNAEAVMAASILRDNRAAAAFIADSDRRHPYARVIREELDAAIGSGATG